MKKTKKIGKPVQDFVSISQEIIEKSELENRALKKILWFCKSNMDSLYEGIKQES